MIGWWRNGAWVCLLETQITFLLPKALVNEVRWKSPRPHVSGAGPDRAWVLRLECCFSGALTAAMADARIKLPEGLSRPSQAAQEDARDRLRLKLGNGGFKCPNRPPAKPRNQGSGVLQAVFDSYRPRVESHQEGSQRTKDAF